MAVGNSDKKHEGRRKERQKDMTSPLNLNILREEIRKLTKTEMTVGNESS
jgi:hypothetical protein